MRFEHCISEDLNLQGPKLTAHANGLDMSFKCILCKSAYFSDLEINLPTRFSCCKDNRTMDTVEKQNLPEIIMRLKTLTRRHAANHTEKRCIA